MDLTGDRRGQSIQIGAIILFGALIILLSTYQAFVVPDQNREVEFKHSQAVQNDMKELRSDLITVASSGGESSVSVQLGTEYPSRAIFLNPGPPSGSLRTMGTGNANINISVANATATGGTTEVGDFWNGTTRNYSSGDIVYKPNYNEYTNAPTTVYSNTVLYNQLEGGNLTLTDQSLIEGRSVSLIALNGSLSGGQSGSQSVDVRATSASTTRVAVTDDSTSGNVTISFPTRLSQSEWQELLKPQLVKNGGHVRNESIKTTDLSGEFDRLIFELEPGVTYNLKLSRVGVGSRIDTTTPPAYLVKTQGQNAVVPEGQNVTLAAQARDAYNNPSSGETVNASTSRSDSSVSFTESDGDGIIELTYSPPDDIDGGAKTDKVNVSLNENLNESVLSDSSFNASTPENITFVLSVDNTNGSGTQNGNGSTSEYAVTWERPAFTAVIESSPNGSLTQSNFRGTPFLSRVADNDNGLVGQLVRYSVTNATNTSVAPSDGTTNVTGYNETRVLHDSDGRSGVYVSAGGDNDKVGITVDRLLNESFEDDANTLVSNGWKNESTDGVAGVEENTSAAPAGDRYAYIDGPTSANERSAIELNYSLDTSNYDALTLTYIARQPGGSNGPSGSSMDTSENLSVAYRNDTGNWVQVDDVPSGNENSSPIEHYRRVRIESVDNASHQNFVLNFSQGEADPNDEWQIDGIELVGLNTSAVSDLNQAPKAHFRYSPSSPTTDDSVTFWANRSDDPDNTGPLSYEWDWDDDGTYEGTGENPPDQTFSQGDNAVTLRVNDSEINTTTTQTISIDPANSDAESVSYVSGTSSSSNGNDFTFDIDTGGNSVTLQNVSVDTSTMPNGVRNELNEITVDSTDERTNSADYSSDGTREPLNSPTITGTSSITFSNFNKGSSGDKLPSGSYMMQSGEPSSGDYLTVTIGFSDGSESVFYFTPP
jgi:hypothetical protein